MAIMRASLAMKVAAPMLSLGVLLFASSLFAAWNIHQQQMRVSEMVAREVYGLLAVSELHITMREIRYRLNLFLRTHDHNHLRNALALDSDAMRQLNVAADLVRNKQEHDLIETVTKGYRRFNAEVARIAKPMLQFEADGDRPSTPTLQEDVDALSQLADERLTKDVLTPLLESMTVNRQVLERMDEAGRATARHLANGLLVLGVCGAAAGLFLGIAVSRAVVGRLRRSETELLRREQLAHVGQLAAGMAHELRNPLMPMKMLVQAAIERRDAGLTGRSLVVMNEEIQRLEKSIQGFLDFARPTLPQKSPGDLRELVTPTLDLVAARAARQGITMAASLAPAPVAARVDRGQIRQLLLNLLLNAMDAMPEGGKLEVRVEDCPTGPQSGSLGTAVLSDSAEPALGVAIRVIDEGAGVAEHLLPTVFEPFVTTKESGAGLGLSLCSQIAAAHGGRVTVRNLRPHGAEFALELPADVPN